MTRLNHHDLLILKAILEGCPSMRELSRLTGRSLRWTYLNVERLRSLGLVESDGPRGHRVLFRVYAA